MYSIHTNLTFTSIQYINKIIVIPTDTFNQFKYIAINCYGRIGLFVSKPKFNKNGELVFDPQTKYMFIGYVVFDSIFDIALSNDAIINIYGLKELILPLSKIELVTTVIPTDCWSELYERTS